MAFTALDAHSQSSYTQRAERVDYTPTSLAYPYNGLFLASTIRASSHGWIMASYAMKNLTIGKDRTYRRATTVAPRTAVRPSPFPV